MPWIDDGSGEKKYVVSIYDKDCLPTWDELYNHFYKMKIFKYDPNNAKHSTQMDPYWNRPFRKILMAFVCNQLNKMIFEEKTPISEFLYSRFNLESAKLHFILIENDTLQPGKVIPESVIELIDCKGAPKIYRCKIPSTNEYSIFASNHPYVDIDDLNGSIELIAVASSDVWVSVASDAEFMAVLNETLKPVIAYFENGIGWKDSDGNILPSDDPSHKCEGAGFDPAL